MHLVPGPELSPKSRNDRRAAVGTQVSNATSTDLATTLTKLSQAQTAYQAALESGVTIMNLSILDYIQ